MRDELEQETGLDAMTKAELKAEARARGLPTTGTKAALLERVEQHDSETAGDGSAEEATGETGDQAGTRARRNGADEGEAEEPEPERSAEGEGEAEEEPEPSAEDEGEAEEEPEPEPSAEGEGEAEEEPEPEPSAEDEGEPEDELEPAAAGERRDGDRRAPDLRDVARTAARSLTELTGRAVDAVSGVRSSDDGYVVTVEVLELSRVPSTTDVLATYEVQVSRRGAITGYSRIHRYYRNQTTRE
ncbi:MAG TPA: gas vesicle protein GvpO [Acidimicrobiales bacterium]|nr:gas vesicle protein GvpO [Acidimicrobiales bacterium]